MRSPIEVERAAWFSRETMRKILSTLVLSLGAFLPPLSALADSDGYYCIGPGYVAYERRFEKFDGEPRHTLYKVTFSSKKFGDTQSVVLPDFQTHGLKCNPDGVEVASWEEIFRIGFADGSLKILKREPLVAPGKIPKGYDASWLRRLDSGAITGTKVVPLDKWHTESATSYDLISSLQPSKTAKCRVKLEVKMIQKPHMKEKILFSDEQPTECGE